MHEVHLDFAVALHHQLPTEGNLSWSPYSVASALGLAAAGARGDTQQELARLIAPEVDQATLVRWLSESASLPEAELAVANALWLAAQLGCRDEYRELVRQLAGGAVHQANFADDPEGCRVRINEDVARTTRGLIPHLLAEGMITPRTAAVLVNALYLKVAWLNAFPSEQTAPAPFTTPAGERSVPTMRQQETFRYAEAAGWRMVSLPTPAPVMVDVLLPEVDGTPLTAAAVRALWSAGRSVKVDLWLPRFRVASQALLNEPLAALGVTTPFDPDRADFSGITEGKRMCIDQVVHQAVLRVDEQGFEGAAATAVVMRLVSMDLSRPIPFRVDRPFHLLVRHARTGAIYFLARVTDPTAA